MYEYPYKFYKIKIILFKLSFNETKLTRTINAEALIQSAKILATTTTTITSTITTTTTTTTTTTITTTTTTSSNISILF